MDECGKELIGSAVVRSPIGLLAAERSSARVSRQSAPTITVQGFRLGTSFRVDFAHFHYRDNPSCVWSDGADLKRLAGRGERPDRDRARSTRDRSCSAVPRRSGSDSVVEIMQATACGGDAARRLTDWMMELHALRRARTEGEAERHDVSSDGRSNRHPSESRRVLVPSSASAQSARRATGKNPAFSSGAQVKSHVL